MGFLFLGTESFRAGFMNSRGRKSCGEQNERSLHGLNFAIYEKKKPTGASSLSKLEFVVGSLVLYLTVMIGKEPKSVAMSHLDSNSE